MQIAAYSAKNPEEKLCVPSLCSGSPPSHRLDAAAAPSVRTETPRAITSVHAKNEQMKAGGGDVM